MREISKTEIENVRQSGEANLADFLELYSDEEFSDEVHVGQDREESEEMQACPCCGKDSRFGGFCSIACETETYGG